MIERIHSNLNESVEWIESEDTNSFDRNLASELTSEQTFDEKVDDIERVLFQDDVSRSEPRSEPMIALEQLVEALEERQNSDQRKAVVPIDFADRRKRVRRSSDLDS